MLHRRRQCPAVKHPHTVLPLRLPRGRAVLAPVTRVHGRHTKAVRIPLGTDEGGQGSESLFQHIHSQLGHDNISSCVLNPHSLGRQPRGQPHIHNVPGHRSRHRQQHVVSGLQHRLLDIVRLDLLAHEFLEFPVLVGQQGHRPAGDHHLLPVVLGHRRVPLVHRHQGIRPHTNHRGRQVDMPYKLHGVRLPVVEPGPQQYRLAPVLRQANEPLLHRHDPLVPVDDVGGGQWDLLGYGHVAVGHAVDTRAEEKELPSTARGRAKASFRHYKLLPAAPNTAGQCVLQPGAIPWGQRDRGGVLDPVLALQQVVLAEHPVGRGLGLLFHQVVRRVHERLLRGGQRGGE
mmetsp:Transcript_8043/g.19023  ORF Transcript_8043/g.19023 Transcript_8043/m.19023 type:complete len:344 (-) Transcript_8043:53-1084(-)